MNLNRMTALAFLRSVPWVLVRRIVVAGYLIVLGLDLWRNGVPLGHIGQLVWIVAGLACVCIGRPWRTWLHLVVSWTVFGGVLLVYDYSRGMAYHFTGPFIDGYPAEGAVNPLGMPLHVMFPIRFDEFLFGGTLPTHWIQAHLHPGHTISVIAVVVSLTYLSHFLVTPITAIVLWVRRSPRFNVWIILALAMAIVGLAGYVFYPMTPPWLASRQGYISGPPVLTLTGQGWKYLGIKFASSVIHYGRALANPVAAMPSLHVGYATLATGFFFFTLRRTWVRVIIWCYPLMMCLSLVYGGEHYVTDEIFGVLTAGAILAVWQVWHRRRNKRAEPARARQPSSAARDDTAAARGDTAAAEAARGEPQALDEAQTGDEPQTYETQAGA